MRTHAQGVALGWDVPRRWRSNAAAAFAIGALASSFWEKAFAIGALAFAVWEKAFAIRALVQGGPD